jgi:hypothetical protein
MAYESLCQPFLREFFFEDCEQNLKAAGKKIASHLHGTTVKLNLNHSLRRFPQRVDDA